MAAILKLYLDQGVIKKVNYPIDILLKQDFGYFVLQLRRSRIHERVDHACSGLG